MIARYILFAVLSFTMNLVSWLLSIPLGFLSVALGRDTLPGPLRWVHTHDATLDGGWGIGWPVTSGWRQGWQRARWIMRNPGYGFDAYVLGIPRGPETEVIETFRRGRDDNDPVGYKHNHELIYKGRRYFSRRGKHYWFGWNPYGPSEDRHMFKFSLRNF